MQCANKTKYDKGIFLACLKKYLHYVVKFTAPTFSHFQLCYMLKTLSSDDACMCSLDDDLGVIFLKTIPLFISTHRGNINAGCSIVVQC